jgi:O-antigen/teichoic acid export membrane protein
MMVRLLILARLLSLQDFGTLSLGLLASGTFGMLGCLGLQSLLQREWPVNLVRGQERRGMVRACQCNLVGALCAATALIATAGGRVFLPHVGIVAIGIVHGLSIQLFLIATIESRSRGDPVRYANQNLIRSIVAIVVGIGAAIATKSASAVLIAEALTTIGMALFIFFRAAERSRIKEAVAYGVALRRLRQVDWNSALTLMVIGVVAFLTINVDRWVGADRLSRTDFAQYSFAWIVLAAAQSAQNLINASVYPMLARRLAANGRAAAFRICRIVSLSVLTVGLLAAFPAWLLADHVLRHWFPAYSNAGGLIMIFFAVALLRVSDFWSSFLLIVGRERALLALNVTLLLLCVGGWVALMAVRGVTRAIDVAVFAAILASCCYVGAAGLTWRARFR